MRRTFGNFFTRLLWGGATLTEIEFQLLQHLVTSLPPALRSVVETQLNAYNLVQREIDGRALNFYRRKGRRTNNMEKLPRLGMTVGEAPLVRLTATIAGQAEPVYATLGAVNGRVFCMALNRALPSAGKITVSEVKQAWRSNFSQ